MKEALIIGYGTQSLRGKHKSDLENKGFKVTDKRTRPFTAHSEIDFTPDLVVCIGLDVNTVESARKVFENSHVYHTEELIIHFALNFIRNLAKNQSGDNKEAKTTLTLPVAV